MTELICMRGYSGSGKSTKAAEIAKDSDAVIVNRDYLRKMMLNEWWTGDPEDEDRVSIAEEAQVEALLRSNISVIVDATHLNPAFLRKWAKLATRLGVDYRVVDVIEEVDVCRQRAYARWSRDVGTDAARYIDPAVIERQAKRFPVAKWPLVTAQKLDIVPAEEFEGAEDAVIFDIDGTLAHIPVGGRSPYDYTRVKEDKLDFSIAYLAHLIHRHRMAHIFIVSGRDDSCIQDTLEWLKINNVPFNDLLMRPTDAKDSRGNKLPDFIVKYHLFDKYIRGKYNVRMVFDDRQQVVDMWRQLGLKCLQVAPGDF